MTVQTHPAFAAGIRAAVDLAQLTAARIGTRSDSRHLRQQAAAEALLGLAEGLTAEYLGLPASIDPGERQDVGIPTPSAATDRPETIGLVQREAALAAGYTGDPCGSCGNFTMKRNGTCLSCDTCGATTGCS